MLSFKWLGVSGGQVAGGERGSNHVVLQVAGGQRGSSGWGSAGVRSCCHSSCWGSAVVKWLGVSGGQIMLSFK